MTAGRIMTRAVSQTIICVDTIDTQVSGKICNPYLEEAVPFRSLAHMLLLLDSFFDSVGFPQAACQSRSFFKKPYQFPIPCKVKKEANSHISLACSEYNQGKLATFMVRVQFRQNATWQGTVTWNERQCTQRFRSALELIKLLYGSLQDTAGDTSLF